MSQLLCFTSLFLRVKEFPIGKDIIHTRPNCKYYHKRGGKVADGKILCQKFKERYRVEDGLDNYCANANDLRYRLYLSKPVCGNYHSA